MQDSQEKTVLGLQANLGAMLCYVGNFVCSLGLIYSIVVVVTDKTNKFVRFHAWQSILCSALGLVLGIIGAVVGAVVGIIDGLIGFPVFTLIIGLILLVVGLGLLGMYLFAAFKAYKGETYKIPVIGGFAEKWV